MGPSSLIVIAPDHLVAKVGDESVVLGVEKGTYFGLDPVGARVWDLIQEPTLVSDVRDAIVAEFEVDPDTCERDLLAFIAELREHGMIEILDAPAP